MGHSGRFRQTLLEVEEEELDMHVMGRVPFVEHLDTLSSKTAPVSTLWNVMLMEGGRS